MEKQIKKERSLQLQANVEYLLDMYLNGMSDEPERYPEMSRYTCRAYVKEELFDMKVFDGGSHVKYHKNICEDLKFLGNEEIDRVIDEYAAGLGVVNERPFIEIIEKANRDEKQLDILLGNCPTGYTYCGGKDIRISTYCIRCFKELFDAPCEVVEETPHHITVRIPEQYRFQAVTFTSINAGVCDERHYEMCFGGSLISFAKNSSYMFQRDVAVYRVLMVPFYEGGSRFEFVFDTPASLAAFYEKKKYLYANYTVLKDCAGAISLITFEEAGIVFHWMDSHKIEHTEMIKWSSALRLLSKVRAYGRFYLVPYALIPQMDLKECMKYVSRTVYHGENTYTHANFYETVGSQGIDLFLDIWDGRLLIPCENGLCEWKGEAVFSWDMLCEKTVDNDWAGIYVCTKAEAREYLRVAILEKNGIDIDDEELDYPEEIIEAFLENEDAEGVSYLFTASGGRYV